MRHLIWISVVGVTIHFLRQIDVTYYLAIGAVLGLVVIYFFWEEHRLNRHLRAAFEKACRAGGIR